MRRVGHENCGHNFSVPDKSRNRTFDVPVPPTCSLADSWMLGSCARRIDGRAIVTSSHVREFNGAPAVLLSAGAPATRSPIS
jgi:hypothetical protein